MYFSIPEGLKESWEKSIRTLRRRSLLINFPVLFGIFGGLAILAVFSFGHVLIYVTTRLLEGRFSEAQVGNGVAILILLVVAVVLAIFLRRMVREPIFEEHLLCEACNTVDKDDEGACPKCGKALRQRQTFFFTNYGDEIRLANHRNLQFVDDE